MKDYGKIIYRTETRAYVIGKLCVPHPDDDTVPDEVRRQFAELWADVDAYAEAHPEMVTEEQPYVPPVPTLEEVKAAKISEIKAAFVAAEANGFVESSLGFRADATRRSIEDIDGLIDLVSSGALPAPVTFRDYDNAYHQLTLEQLNTLRLETKGRGPLLYARKWELEGAVDAAETVETLAGIDINTGWPGKEVVA
jgi:hypothetical protein